jgi:hypothetical protein
VRKEVVAHKEAQENEIVDQPLKVGGRAAPLIHPAVASSSP